MAKETTNQPPRRAALWLLATLVVALVYYLPVVQEAFSTANVIQDDARQHVFWMQRYLDPALFPGDLIADYFQSVAPPGYRGLYWLAAKLGLSPLLLHKLLPLPLLLLTAGLCFALTLQLSASPPAAAIASLLLTQGLSLTDAIVSATPKAFLYPLLLGFLYAVARGWRWGIAGAVVLQGLFYPQLVLISAVLSGLRLVDWGRRRLASRSHWLAAAAVLAAAVAVLLPYALQSHGYGPTLTAAAARSLPEMSLSGSRTQFFTTDPAAYWLEGRSGLRLATALTPVTNGLGLLLPLLVWRRSHKLVGLSLLLQVTVASLIMFIAAHLLLFRLHLPSRYTQHSLRVVLSVAAAIALVLLVRQTWRWAQRGWQRGLVGVFGGLLAALVLLYPLATGGSVTAYQVGRAVPFYEFLRQQPANTLVASLSSEANNLPSFTGRSILVGEEYLIPYHSGYYRQMRDRALRLIEAQYSPDPQVVQQLIRDYGITHWLLDGNAFNPRYRQNNGLMQMFPDAAIAGGVPVLQPLAQAETCLAARHRNRLLLDAACLARTLGGEASP
ncbi:MAG: hypothetical protein AAF289_10555 [Cyanobacteria bacterium P01_A01_bin.135]